MKKVLIPNILVLVGVVVFNLLFFGEGMAVNAVIFTVLLIAGLIFIETDRAKDRGFQILALGTLGFAVTTVTANSLFSKVCYLLSSLLLVGVAQRRTLRFLGFGLLVGLWSLLETPLKFWNNLRQMSKGGEGKKGNILSWFFNARLVIAPLFIVSVFFGVYCVANPTFAQLAKDFAWNLLHFFQWDISWQRVGMIILGFFVVGGAWWKNQSDYWGFDESGYKETVQRRWDRRQAASFAESHSMLALKDEYRIAVMTILSLNLLLFMVNGIDVWHVWLGGEKGFSSAELAAFVHQGTYILIFSIVMAMGVLLYFFRKNLNFYPKNDWLKWLSYLWVAQNAVLALSVAARNFRYIEHYGLAYKRTGVIVFVVLVLAGLITMIFKVKDRRTIYYLLHRNAWIWYGVFWVAAWISWDIHISKYNITADYKNNKNIELDFLFNTISDQNIYLLREHQSDLEKRSNWSPDEIEKEIEKKEYAYKKRMESRSWLSWNLPDARNAK